MSVPSAFTGWKRSGCGVIDGTGRESFRPGRNTGVSIADPIIDADVNAMIGIEDDGSVDMAVPRIGAAARGCRGPGWPRKREPVYGDGHESR